MMLQVRDKVDGQADTNDDERYTKAFRITVQYELEQFCIKRQMRKSSLTIMQEDGNANMQQQHKGNGAFIKTAPVMVN